MDNSEEHKNERGGCEPVTKVESFVPMVIEVRIAEDGVY